MWRQIQDWLQVGRPADAPTGGEWGEERAAEFLRRLGYRVIARNWRNPKDRREEIDLVCRDREVLVFVEVKTRSANALVPGYHAVNHRKKKVLRRACQAYLYALRPPAEHYRFDVVEVGTLPVGPPEILHFENVSLF